MVDEPFLAPDIRFIDDKNFMHSLSDFKGQVVVLSFWATWCEPCVREMPALFRLYKALQGKDVAILPISVDFKGVSVVKPFYQQNGLENFPIFLDDKGRAFKDFKIQALPSAFVIDRKGNVVAKVMGEMDWDNEANKNYLLQLNRAKIKE